MTRSTADLRTWAEAVSYAPAPGQRRKTYEVGLVVAGSEGADQGARVRRDDADLLCAASELLHQPIRHKSAVRERHLLSM